MQTERCIGTYIHGFLDNSPVIEYLLRGFDTQALSPALSPQEYKEQQYDLLADHVRRHVDIDRIYQILQAP